jgi:quercetin dioxygenase-like cupin family protein
MKKTTKLSPAESGVCSLLEPVSLDGQGMVSHAVLTTPTLRLTVFHFAPGQGLGEHSSKARALVQILTGTCQFTAAGTTHSLKPGDLLHLPPLMPHSVTSPEAFSMLLTQFSEPAV